MESHIKYIGNIYPALYTDGTVNTIDDIFRPLCDEDKLRYSLQQALFISYYNWLYDVRSNEFMYRYAVSLREYIYKTKLNLDGIYVDVRNILDKVIASWFSQTWTDVPICHIVNCVISTANLNYPSIFANRYNELMEKDAENKENILNYEKEGLSSVLIPYLMFRNSHLEEGYTVWNKNVSVPQFSITLAIGPYDKKNHSSGRYNVYRHNVGIGFFANINDKISALKPGYDKDGTIQQYLFNDVPFLGFVSQLQFGTDRLFDNIIRTLAGLNLSMDEFSKYTRNSALFYDADVVLRDMFAVDFASRGGYRPLVEARLVSGNIGRPADENLLRTFRLLCELDEFKFSSHTLFHRFFAGLCSSQSTKRILDYCKQFLVKEGPRPAEEALAYNESVLGGLEAIQLFSQYDSGQTEPDEKQEEQAASDDEVDLDIDENFDEGVAEPGLEADDNSDPSEDNTEGDSSTDGDQDADDSSPESEGSNPDDPEIEEDNSSQDTGDTDSASGGADDNSDQSVTQTTGTPEEIDASDIDGIPIEISAEGSETVDSVILREEIDQFITNILVNPPKELSPQSVEALTTLQKCWVHILTVETVVRIMDRLIAIPKKFKNIITQVELKQDE